MNKSLFCARNRQPSSHDYPYHLWLRELAISNERRFAGAEVDAFAQVIEHEVQYYECRGLCAGPVSMMLSDGSVLGNADSGHRFKIPTWVEADNVQFRECRISAIVLVEAWAIFDRLCRAKAWRRLNAAIICGHGIPRAGTRRFVHRLSEQSNAPVFLLTDCDTWGYFIFSLLKRGLLAPHTSFPWLAINDLRFLGVRVGDARDAITRGLKPRLWQRGWKARMQCLGKYDCFASEEWQLEFHEFQQMSGAVNLVDVYRLLGPKAFVDNYLRPRIRHGSGLQ